jgi:hypothetical protein
MTSLELSIEVLRDLKRYRAGLKIEEMAIEYATTKRQVWRAIALLRDKLIPIVSVVRGTDHVFKIAKSAKEYLPTLRQRRNQAFSEIVRQNKVFRSLQQNQTRNAFSPEELEAERISKRIESVLRKELE